MNKGLTELVQQLVAIRSLNPPGNENEIANFAKDFLVQNGIQAQLVPLEEGRSSVVGRIPGKGKGCIVVCGHLDTVGISEGQWTKPPFDGVIENGKLFGRGAADMKGGVAIALESARQISKLGEKPEKSIVLALTADEEWQYRGAASIVASGLIDDCEFLIVTEPTDSVPYIGQKGELWVEVLLTGKAAHGSVPQEGIDTIQPGAEFCLRLAERIRELPPLPARGETTLTIGQFQGGWRINIVADQAKIGLDIRVACEEHKTLILEYIQQLGNEIAARTRVGFSSQVTSYNPPIASDPDGEYVSQFVETALGGEFSAENVGLVPYYTDAGMIVPKLDVPVIVFGPGRIAQAHQPDEYLELDSLEKAFGILMKCLVRASKLPI